MADENKIFYKIEVHGEQGLATIRNMKGEFVKTKVPVENLNKVLSDMGGTLSVTTNAAGRQMSKLKKLRGDVQVNSKEYQNLTKSMMAYQKVLDGTTGATGASASAAMELGRVVSDMPYGIRGVANNLSQFASQMAFSARATGSLKLAIKGLFSALTGPLGVLLAIQAVIAAFDHFSQQSKDTSEEQKKLNDELERTQRILSELNAAQVALAGAGETLSLASSDLMLSLTTGVEEFNKEQLLQILERDVKGITNAFQRLSEEEQNIEGIRGLLQKRKDLVKAQMDEKEIKEQLVELEKRYSGFRTESGLLDMQAAKDAKQALIDKQNELLATQHTIVSIEAMFEKIKKSKKEDKEAKISPFKTPEELDIELKSIDSVIIKYNKQIEKAKLTEEMNDKLRAAGTEEDKQKIRQEYQVKQLKSQISFERKMLEMKLKNEKIVINAKTDAHIEDLRRATDLYIHKIKLNDKLTDAQKKAAIGVAESQFTNAKAQATKEEVDSLQAVEEQYAPLFELFESLGEARVNALMSGFGLGKKKKKDDKDTGLTPLQEGLQEFMTVMSAATDFMDAEFQRQITIEKNKTNALNNELNERLLNENLSKEERKRIQLEIGANDESLRKKQEKIAKKRFKLNKAANIGQALVSTYLNFVKAQASQYAITTPDAPARAAIAGKMALAKGLFGVAMIARQKFQSSAGSGGQIGGGFGGGSGSGGGNDRSFNFNLAGASRENQLATTLQGRFNQPLQAYVVSRDIRNQQQLDEDIRNNASFG